ncbi:Sag1p KNAG_0H02380 [Huiozyma naganishii CBS 8797]|uniref:Agglutinin-like protein N-terminal domain-containing protein n=1 Tax=Huiozyma naganishii (strain ATCC MYA-139 / BCRC 22969 / CBS 8797 / KCTC 17520 / NBRC 10181 / NCYC 3082 / Yp74L-3) TaxID=1071383 RepID=J7RPK3_HUIN7|nr:hypothetical protein KNAG_0H02380 [Kazachstania naganishii CBS 8797]CCK71653.1 hypothetical protein KNAG_0H02380 [Kazachstania naganishii CBS 8797]
MLSLLHLILEITLVSSVFAADISNIAFSNLQFKSTDIAIPSLGWITTFDFDISDASKIQQGDSFSISLPYVYRIKFENDAPNMDVSMKDGTTVFNCYASQQAAYKFSDSILTCFAIKDLTMYEAISGTISFPLNFNDGGSITQNYLDGANFFKSGSMQVSFSDELSAPITFDPVHFNGNSYTMGRTTTYGSAESYHLGMSCPNGYLVGGEETIFYDMKKEGYTLDCPSVQVGVSSNFNDFLLPKDISTTNPDYVCNSAKVRVQVGQLQAGEMVFIDALQALPEGPHTIYHSITAAYTCMDTNAGTTYTTDIDTVNLIYATQAADEGHASVPSRKPPTVTTTTTVPWTGSYTTTYSTETTETTNSGSTTPEIIIHVETPNPPVSLNTLTTTTTVPWTGSYTTTYSTETTETTNSGSTTPEIIIHVETPNPPVSLNTLTTTTTVPWTGSYTTTYSTETTETTNSGSTTPEIIIHVETPNPPVSVHTMITTTTTNSLISFNVSTCSSQQTSKPRPSSPSLSAKPSTSTIERSSTVSVSIQSKLSRSSSNISSRFSTETSTNPKPHTSSSRVVTISPSTFATSVSKFSEHKSLTTSNHTVSVVPPVPSVLSVSVASSSSPHFPTPLRLEVSSLSSMPPNIVFSGAANFDSCYSFSSLLMPLLSLLFL